MSWARLDDTFWRHLKVSSLLEPAATDGADDRAVLEALAAVGLWTLGLSYTNQKGSPDLSSREAMMVVGVDAQHRSLIDSLRRRLRDVGLLEAPAKQAEADAKQTSEGASQADLYHDWQNYRSKDEAKARAGSQGGKKSAESRREKSKQAPSSSEAGSQAELKPRSPIPIPQVCRDQAVTLDEFTTAIANAGIALQTGRSEREWFSKLHPVDRSELDHALDCAGRAKSKPRRAAYVLEIIESERRKAEDIAQQPKPPPRRQRQDDDSDFVPPYLRPENNWSLQERLARERESQQAAEPAEVEP